MNLTIHLPDADVPTLKAKATALGVSTEQYALQVLGLDLAPDWLRESWASAKETGLDQLSMDEIDAEIAARGKSGITPSRSPEHDQGGFRHKHYRPGFEATASAASPGISFVTRWVRTTLR